MASNYWLSTQLFVATNVLFPLFVLYHIQTHTVKPRRNCRGNRLPAHTSLTASCSQQTRLPSSRRTFVSVRALLQITSHKHQSFLMRIHAFPAYCSDPEPREEPGCAPTCCCDCHHVLPALLHSVCHRTHQHTNKMKQTMTRES